MRLLVLAAALSMGLSLVASTAARAADECTGQNCSQQQNQGGGAGHDCHRKHNLTS